MRAVTYTSYAVHRDWIVEQAGILANSHMTSPYETNRRAWDAMARTGHAFTRPAQDEDFANPLPAIDIAGWVREVAGKRVLCLAAGGGRQGPLFAAAGAQVTVVDLSPAMLEIDRRVAQQRGLELRTLEASMDQLAPLQPASFDLVYQPVSTCYVPSVIAVYREIARVLTPGGMYISQHKQPASLQATIQSNSAGSYELVEPYYRAGPLRTVRGSILREESTLEYLHRWEELIGGLCRAGFVIEDLIEPVHAKPHAEIGSFAHRATYIAPYLRIKARRVQEAPQPSTDIWLPSG